MTVCRMRSPGSFCPQTILEKRVFRILGLLLVYPNPVIFYYIGAVVPLFQPLCNIQLNPD